jgi:plastocyanin
MRNRTFVHVLAVLVLSGGCSGNGGTEPEPTPQTGTISGAVLAAGAGVAGAQVALSAGGTQTTDAAGQYAFAGVAAGNHTLTITLPAGYELEAGQTAAKPVAVAAGQTASVGWSLRRTGPAPQSVEVQMGAGDFTPSDVSIGVGGTVRWVNATATAHTITPNTPSQPGAWASQNISGQGTVFSHTFGTAGTFNYNCALHAGMTGVVRVQ